jgi:hypothetical protein
MDVDRERILIIDNSERSFGKTLGDYQVEYFPENKGVGSSWNIGFRRGAEYNILISASMYFKNGISELVKKLSYANEYGLLTYEGWHTIVIGRKTIDTIGEIDENFYPAYYEDNDYMYRMKLADIHNKPFGATLPKIDIDVECAGNAMSVKSGLVVDFEKNAAYYEKKWGGKPGQEKYTKPFNEI